METRFGYLLEDWYEAREEMTQICIEIAKVCGAIPYSELCRDVKAITIEPDSYALTAMLNEISTEEDYAGRGMLTAVVVHKRGDQQPGPGFFELAEKLGRDISNILKCWVDELNFVHAYWSNQ